MIQQLSEKYGEQFAVDSQITNRYFYGSDKFIAHPVADGGVLVLAYWNESGELVDTYAQARWSHELTRAYEGEVRAALGPDVLFRAYPLVSADKLPAPDAPLQTFAEFVKLNPSCTVVFVVGLESGSDAASIAAISQGLYDVYGTLGSLGTDRYSLAVGLVEDASAFNEHMTAVAVSNTGWQNAGAGVNAYAVINAETVVNGPQDIADSFQQGAGQ